ncbi:MAG: hypothetical protein RL272_1081, partial [Candidatus Parcubacteria bacterium]
MADQVMTTVEDEALKAPAAGETD